MKNFVYLILDHESKKAAMVDPQKDLSEPLAVLKEKGFTLVSIILTHTHHDHTAGVGPLLSLDPTLEIWVGQQDLHRLSQSVLAASGLRVIKEEQTFRLGQLEITAILTPGHSAGAVSYFIPGDEPCVFTGDTIFIRDCGRTDLETGSNADMFSSIQKIKKLPLETRLWVGHHYAPDSETTLQKELNESPPFRVTSVDELAALP